MQNVTSESQTSATMPTVLIAEDAAHVRKVCGVILQDHGFQVIEAENGVEAVQMYIGHRPGAVVMDISMPQLEGLGALARIRAVDPDARVIMLTALGEKSQVLAAIHAGARDYVVKPFQVERLVQAVRKLLRWPASP